MRRDVVVFFAIVGLLLGAYCYFGARSHLGRIEELQTMISTAQQRVSDEERRAGLLSELEDNVVRMEGWMQEAREFFASEESTPELLLDIASALHDSGLKSHNIEPALIREFPPLQRQAVRMTVSGPFAGVFDFIRRIEDSRPFSRVEQIELQNREGSVIEANITVVRIRSVQA